MRNLRKILTAAACLVALQSGTALAATNIKDDMPSEGRVTRVGTVERVVDNDTFILRDQRTGDTSEEEGGESGVNEAHVCVS